jgi:hypothetical protein
VALEAEEVGWRAGPIFVWRGWESLGSARSLGGPAAPVDFGRQAKGAGSNSCSLPLPINC